MTTNKSEDRTNPSKLKPGDRLSETQYYEVTALHSDRVEVKNERGYPIFIGRDIIREGMYSANQFTEEKQVTRTELAEILENAGDTIFTVCFLKQVKEADLKRQLKDITGKKTAAKQVNSLAKDLLAGEERVLVGYLIGVEPKMGRSQVIDLEAPTDHRIRQVDHRTLQWMVYKNVKYVVKK